MRQPNKSIEVPDTGDGLYFTMSLNPEAEDAIEPLSANQLRSLACLAMNQLRGDGSEPVPYPIPDNIELGQE